MLFRHVCTQAVVNFNVNKFYEGLLVGLLIVSICHIEHLGNVELGHRLVHKKHFNKSAYMSLTCWTCEPTVGCYGSHAESKRHKVA